jgi:hypothetical protein
MTSTRRTGVRLHSLIALLTATALLSACGGQAAKPGPAGSRDNPLVGKPTKTTADGRSNEAAAATDAASVSGAERSISGTAPCRLVSRTQARAILGAPIQAPLEAPQGPTCIYRTKTGKGYVTLAVQPLDFTTLTRRVQQRERLDIARRAAYCGMNGQPMLYAQVARGWVLSIAAPCRVARQFAAKALAQLG